MLHTRGGERFHGVIVIWMPWLGAVYVKNEVWVKIGGGTDNPRNTVPSHGIYFNIPKTVKNWNFKRKSRKKKEF